MKVAVIGSRNLTVKDLGRYLPSGTTEIISGGAKGVDTCAMEYATSHGIKLTEFTPDYARYGRNAAPLKRNITIIENADLVLAFWDGSSRGTKYVIEKCRKINIEVKVYLINPKTGLVILHKKVADQFDVDDNQFYSQKIPYCEKSCNNKA